MLISPQEVSAEQQNAPNGKAHCVLYLEVHSECRKPALSNEYHKIGIIGTHRK